MQEKHLAIKRPVYENSVEPFDLEKIIGKTLLKNKTTTNPCFGPTSTKYRQKNL